MHPIPEGTVYDCLVLARIGRSLVRLPSSAQYLRIEGVTDQLNDRAGGPVGWTLGLIKGFMPGFVEPWLTAVIRNPSVAAVIVIGFLKMRTTRWVVAAYRFITQTLAPARNQAREGRSQSYSHVGQITVRETPLS